MTEASTEEQTRARTESAGGARRDYAAFDAELTHQAFNFRLFLRLLGWLRPYRVTVFVSIALVVLAAVAGVMMPVLTGRVAIDSILLPIATDVSPPDYGLVDLNNWLALTAGIEPLTAATILYVLLVVLNAVLMLVHRLTLASAALKALRDLRLDLFRSLERKPASFFDHVAIGRVMTRVTNDVENLFMLISGFGMLAGEFVPFFLALGLMLMMSVEVTGVVLIAVPLAAIATVIFRRAMRDIFRLIRNSVSALNQYMQENLVGMEVVQLSGRQAMNAVQYGELNRDNRHQEYRAINYEVVYDAFNNSLIGAASAAVVWYGGGEVVQQEISLGSMVLFTQLVGMLVMPVVALGQQFNTLFRSMASGERIFQALDWDESQKEPDDPVELPERLAGHVEFRDAHFSYIQSDPVLRGVSFEIPAGHKLAIVGPTGSGKSTIIRLLARFYDFDDGQVFLDGIDVNRIASADLRARLGIVLQDFHVFSGTVLDNITLNDTSITRERAIWAAKMVNADGFIRELADGYDTRLSERGQNLSQGQRQLLAFARVLARDPEILVLDEATASIDTATEILIQDALRRLTAGRTSIIIAHRLQTIQECDSVLVLHHGQVAEHGSHEELLAKKGIYYTLHELQFQDASDGG